jgi:hypothetical protein
MAVKRWFGSKMRRHHRVRHSAREYARTEGTTRVHIIHINTIEGFFGLFKRGIFGIFGIHHNVSAKHLHRYALCHRARISLQHTA